MFGGGGKTLFSCEAVTLLGLLAPATPCRGLQLSACFSKHWKAFKHFFSRLHIILYSNKAVNIFSHIYISQCVGCFFFCFFFVLCVPSRKAGEREIVESNHSVEHSVDENRNSTNS